eukprot:TRINITY_DN48210_c0_g1_i1.p1 TRINITY_DN48210_c0_g1~~TRINITY_DN48210_c0_g1_i1.p1  ORF type:complete len:272 (+),score=56.15 TRINITY_DN48210_c0_g1_i1:124-939(+)
MVAIEALEGVLEKLLQDDDTKDVEIQMQDGILRAHYCILSAASEAIKGMLRHGLAAKEGKKTLNWSDHSVEVGRFFMRLLYTGTIVEEEWGASDAHTEGRSSETPLRLLLGALSISRVYQVPHLLHALVEALKARLNDETFDDVFAAAIKMDVIVLRLHCLRYAERSDSKEIIEGVRVRALRYITVQNADVPEGSIGTVNNNHVIEWDDTGSIGYGTDMELVRGMVELVSSPVSNRVREMYLAKELRPEVMFELAALWGPAAPAMVRRRTF